MSDFVESTKEASRGGFQGIKKVRGLLVDLKLVDPPESWDTTRRQLQGTLEETAILEMFPGEEEFELKDGKYTFLIGYAEEGKTPHANSPYMKCWVASAEKVGKKPSDFIGQVVTLDKVATVLFKQAKLDDKKKPILDEEGKKVYEDVIVTSTFSFVADETADSENIKDYIRSKIVGLNQKAALRQLLIDTRAKQFPEFKEMLNNGTLADYLELVIVNEKFQESRGGEGVVEEASAVSSS